MSIKQGLCGLILVALSMSAMAEVKMMDAWVRLLPPGVKTTAAYLTIVSDQQDRLIGAKSAVCERVELHETRMEDGMMSMSEVDGLDLSAKVPVALSPGGYHFMLRGLKAPLHSGQEIQLMLHFEQQGQISVMAKVEQR